MQLSGLPILGPGVELPAAVRAGSPKRQEEYRAALAFERQLLGELTKQLAQTSENPDDTTQSAATKTYRDQLPGVLADALISAGGVGLAASIDAAQHPEDR